MKRSALKQLIKEVVSEYLIDDKDILLEENSHHPYSQSVADISAHIVAKAARIRDEYHIPYKDALETMLRYIKNEAEKMDEPKQGFPA